MSLIATRIQDWVVSNPDLSKNENRACEYGAMQFFVDQTSMAGSIVSPQLAERAFNSVGTNIKAPVLNYNGNVQVTNSRQCTIADARSTSGMVTFNWTTLFVGFTMVPLANDNNYISYDEEFANNMKAASVALANAVDELCEATLDANKTTVFPDTFQYPVQGNVVSSSWDNRNYLLGDLGTMFREMCFQGGLNIVGNYGVERTVRHLQQHGLYNDVNKRNEYDNKSWYFSGNVENESSPTQMGATGYAVTNGNVGLLYRVSREARARLNSNFHEWDIVNLPNLGNIPVELHYYTEVGDQSAWNGESTADETCTKKEFFGFAIDIATVVAYNSDPATRYNPILKFQVEANDSQNAFARPVRIVNSQTDPVYTATA